jgi:MSHA biogenesis protein MshO
VSRPVTPASGFTLVELTVAIVIAAIIAGFIVLFLDAPIQSYFAQTRRSDLVDSANRISHTVTADVRTALPNSLRVTNSGRIYALEFLATQGVARYFGNSENPGGELDMSTPVMSFATLDTFDPAANPPYNHLSVGNLGGPPNVPNTYDAYVPGNNVMTRTGVTIAANPGGGDLVTLSTSMTFRAPVTPAAHNAYLVSGPVSYVCNPTAKTFVRYSGYPVRAAQTIAPGGVSALIAHDVLNCAIFVVPAPGGYPPPAGGYPYGELAILSVVLANGGETLQVFLEAPAQYSQ